MLRRGRASEHSAIRQDYTLKTKPKYKPAKKYNLTPEDYESLLKKQNFKCAICLQYGKLCIDHDHATNKVRGLLCTRCNVAIGLLKEHPEYIRRALTYLRVL
jgi:Autographiviridae endonuclease VII